LHPTHTETGASTSAAAESVPDMQVTIRSGMNLLQFRDLTVSPKRLRTAACELAHRFSLRQTL
jgi:hypothetical protein